jgi:hypothetical protein
MLYDRRSHIIRIARPQDWATPLMSGAELSGIPEASDWSEPHNIHTQKTRDNNTCRHSLIGVFSFRRTDLHINRLRFVVFLLVVFCLLFFYFSSWELDSMVCLTHQLANSSEWKCASINITGRISDACVSCRSTLATLLSAEDAPSGACRRIVSMEGGVRVMK